MSNLLDESKTKYKNETQSLNTEVGKALVKWDSEPLPVNQTEETFMFRVWSIDLPP